MKENNNTVILATVIALLLGGIIGYILGSSSSMTIQPTMSSVENMVHSNEHHDLGESHMQHHDDMNHMGMMVTSERAFIEGMIPHHQEAIDTAQEVLERGGTTSEIRILAEDIVREQEREINEMKQWYLAWYGEAYQDIGEYTPMMRNLSELRGVNLDRTFLEDMVAHHMGAIMMARSVQPYIEHDELAELTKAVIETQSEEIQHMQRMLREM